MDGPRWIPHPRLGATRHRPILCSMRGLCVHRALWKCHAVTPATRPPTRGPDGACQGCAVTILLFTACCFCAFFVGELLDARRAKKAGEWVVASASSQQARLPETSDTVGRVSVVHNPMQGDTVKSAAAGKGSNRPAAKRGQGQNAATVHTGPSDGSHSHQDNPTAML